MYRNFYLAKCAVIGTPETPALLRVLDNFHSTPITLFGRRFKTSEHLYQALSTTSPGYQRIIACMPTPALAKYVAHIARKKYGVPAWNDIKVLAMNYVLMVKLLQNWKLVGLALDSTNGSAIVEISSTDAFWGAWRSSVEPSQATGLNVLGNLWECIRTLRATALGRRPDARPTKPWRGGLTAHPPKMANGQWPLRLFGEPLEPVHLTLGAMVAQLHPDSIL